MRKKKAGMIVITVPYSMVGANSVKKDGMMNKTPKKSRALCALSYFPLLMQRTVLK
jgi:hypothetical protein